MNFRTTSPVLPRDDKHSLGAHWEGDGVSFSVFSESGTGVELILFEPDSPNIEWKRVALERREGGLWNATVSGLEPGALYNYRVHGPWAPRLGQRFDPSKLLLDPYARAMDRSASWHSSMQSVDPVSGERAEDADSLSHTPRCRVIDPAFDWGDDDLLHHPWSDVLIYEAHVKGMTAAHKDIPEETRGTYLGMVEPPILEHLHRMGVTAIELLPIHQVFHERHLVRSGLSNYWGYSPIGYFAPDPRFATLGGDPVREFKTMVKKLHASGFEVILDVVYNHTGEGSALGPTISFRGLDNASYYRLDELGHQVDFTGCGNTLDMSNPQVLQLVMDSLRYWVQEMHVDGFRFDLATALGRHSGGYRRDAPFFLCLQQDPILSKVKWIAEPWDLGHEGYRLGDFPRGWSEWNGKYRDSIRSFWNAQVPVSELATRLAGSSDLFESTRGPRASLNFITAHDGFTLQDLVSYQHKHNEANLEDNRDGHDDNRSANWGFEGPSRDPEILDSRDLIKRNLIMTLAFSLGVPMIAHGDEMGRSQEGNNNAYCQDNEMTWVSWETNDREKAFMEFVAKAIDARQRHFPFRGQDHLDSTPHEDTGRRDVVWLAPGGIEVTEEEWHDPSFLCLGMLLRDQRPAMASSLLLINGSSHSVAFCLPADDSVNSWTIELDTASPEIGRLRVSQSATLPPLSMKLLASDNRESHDKR